MNTIEPRTALKFVFEHYGQHLLVDVAALGCGLADIIETMTGKVTRVRRNAAGMWEAFDLVKAAAPPTGSEAVQAQMAVELPAVTAGAPLPVDIQWMPPGRHQITASVNGKPGTRAVSVTAKTAERAQAALAENLAAVEAGTEDRFYFDFNHSDAEASGHPTEFYWAGDDPKAGGVRAKLEWSDQGAAAVKGKSYRRFSPSFYLDAAGEVTGVPVNAGGLVNRAAFKKIQPVRAKEATTTNPNHQESTRMNQLLLVLASAGIIKDQNADEAAAAAQVQAYAAGMRAQLAEGVTARSELDTLKAAHQTLVKAHATTVVDAAIAEGKIPGQNTEIKAAWIEQITTNPSAEKLLAATPANPALKQVVNAKGAAEQNKAIDAKGGDGTGEHEFVIQARALQSDKKVSFEFACDELAAKEPTLYDRFRHETYGT